MHNYVFRIVTVYTKEMRVTIARLILVLHVHVYGRYRARVMCVLNISVGEACRVTPGNPPIAILSLHPSPHDIFHCA